MLASPRKRPYFPDGFVCRRCGRLSWVRLTRHQPNALHPFEAFIVCGLKRRQHIFYVLSYLAIQCGHASCAGYLHLPQIDVLCDYLDERDDLVHPLLRPCTRWLLEPVHSAMGFPWSYLHPYTSTGWARVTLRFARERALGLADALALRMLDTVIAGDEFPLVEDIESLERLEREMQKNSFKGSA